MKMLLLTVTYENDEEGQPLTQTFRNFIPEHLCNILETEIGKKDFVSAKVEIVSPHKQQPQ